MISRRLLAALLALCGVLPSQAATIAPIRLVVPTLGAGAPIISSPGSFSGTLSQSFTPAPQLQQVPLLAPSLITSPAPSLILQTVAPADFLKTPLAPEQMSTLATVAGLQRFTAGLQQTAAPSFSPADLSGKFFDNVSLRGPPVLAPSDVPATDGGASPKLPPGVKRVTVDVIRSVDDIERVVPNGINSDELKAQLKRDVRKMAPYSIYTYHDSVGGKFTAIDLSANPKLASLIPELQAHEVRLIQKLQGWNKDLQVLIREDGKTPDVVIGGQVTELKSLIGRQVDMEFLVNKANKQVLEHGRRHGLGHGALALDLTDEYKDEIPVDYVIEVLDKWQAKAGTVVLDQVIVFAGSDRKMFRRGKDGRYSPEEPGIDFNGGTSRTIRPNDIGKMQFMIRKGKLEGAHRKLHQLESGKNLDAHHPLNQLREHLESERVLRKIEKLVGQNKTSEAVKTWQSFALTHSLETVAKIKPKIDAVLPLYDLHKDVAIAKTPDIAQIAREIEDPPQRLREKGIRATITVYGSARILPEAEAKARYDALTAKLTGRKLTVAERKELKEAGRAVTSSKYYTEAQRFGALVAGMGQGQIAIVTGGGPGIMEAANRGAFEAGGPSVGYNISLPHEQQPNPYLSEGLSFDFENFATRKMSLRHGAVALVYFPGGFGTMDELFEVLTLMQTGKMQKVPIVLLGHKDYWSQVLDFDEFAAMGLISPGDLSLFKFAETAEEAWAAISASNRR